MSEAAALLYIFLSAVFGILFIAAWASIFSKAGYSGWFCLLLFIPVVNIILFLWFAFSTWPVHKNVDPEHTPPSP
jgi:Na+/melibiose symporter-like transporter